MAGMFGRTSPEESRRLADERRARFEARNSGAAEERLRQAEREFFDGPIGGARLAKQDGDRWYQVEIPVNETDRAESSRNFGVVKTTHRRSTGQGAVITAIEDEGWELFQAGFVFHETGQVSRDKLMLSGQNTKTTGITMGVYLFKVTDRPGRTDEPWLDAEGE